MFGKKFPRWGAVVALLVVLGGISLAMVWGSEMPAQAAADDTVSPVSLQRVSSRLESLHQRAVTRSQGNDDDKAGQAGSSATQGITPERAAQLAVQSSGGGHPTRIDRRTAPNGKAYYEIQVEANPGPNSGPRAVSKPTLRVDSETGAVTTE